MNSKNAVFSFYNTPSGLFKWWDEFPLAITDKLNKHNIDHICFYRSYTDNSLHKLKAQNVVKENSIKWLYSVYKLTKQYDNVIFHTHSYYPPLKVFLLTLFTRTKWVITEHRLGSSPSPKWKKTLREALRKVKLMPKHVICVSDAVLERNKQLYGNNVTRIHNGINFPNSTNNKKAGNTPKVALYVGRLDPKKGIWNLVKAFNIIINDKKRTDLKLVVVGGGAILEDLKAYSLENNLTEHITFAGYQTDPSSYYQQADFLIIPTIIKEACPLVSLEARNFGLPLLYANSGGLPETVGGCGLPLSGTSEIEIAKSIINFCEDKDRYQMLLKNTKVNLDYFSIERMTDEYIDFYLAQIKNNDLY